MGLAYSAVCDENTRIAASLRLVEQHHEPLHGRYDFPNRIAPVDLFIAQYAMLPTCIRPDDAGVHGKAFALD
jgi:hypothetical protein